MMNESDVVESVNASVNASVNESEDSERGYIPGESDKRCKYCMYYNKGILKRSDRGGCHMYYQFLKQRGELGDEDIPFRTFITSHGKTYIIVYGDGMKPVECSHFRGIMFPEAITMHAGRRGEE